MATARPLAAKLNLPTRTSPRSSCGVFLGEADLGEFRVRVDDVRAGAVVHVARLAGHRLDAGDAFFLGLVGEHQSADHVADRVDAGDVGLKRVRVDFDETALVLLDADLFKPELRGERAGGRRRRAATSASSLTRSSPVLRTTCTLSPTTLADSAIVLEVELQPLLFEHALEGASSSPCPCRGGCGP